jgi:hypothetical protein
MVLAAGSLAALASPAQAYDRSTCNAQFGAGNVASVDIVRQDNGQANEVDFGDGLHLGGEPLGNAVVCWSKNGKAAVVGRLYADASDGSARVSAQITYLNNGVASAYAPSWQVLGTFWVAEKEVKDVSPPNQFVDKVRIQLFNESDLISTHPRKR